MLDFKPVTLKDKERIEKYSFKYGENSCQHSFVSMYTHSGKYGDSFAEKDGWLYVCRTHLNTDREKVYLCPMGDTLDEESLRTAIRNLLTDAAEEGKRAVLYTVTSKAKDRIEQAFPRTFRFFEIRDSFEYLYLQQKLAKLSGSQFQTRRRQCRLFYRRYSGRVTIEDITPNSISEILDFQHRWLKERMANGGDTGLCEEDIAIKKELSEYEALDLFGIIIRIDGSIAGYAFGVPVSEDCFDLLAEKGDRSIPYIYQVLKRELPDYCSKRYVYFNWEEDVGNPGLREMKLRYHPDILMVKYRAEEVSNEQWKT